MLYLLSSIERFFITIFRAAFEALYEYQPPDLLSVMLPTLAERNARVDLSFFFSFLWKLLAINVGMRVFILIISRNWSLETSSIRFSGMNLSLWRMPMETIILSKKSLSNLFAAWKTESSLKSSRRILTKPLSSISKSLRVKAYTSDCFW